MDGLSAKIFKEMIASAEVEIARLQSIIDATPPPSPERLHTLQDLQHMYRANIDRLRESIRELN
jgi:hypothetical protein